MTTLELRRKGINRRRYPTHPPYETFYFGALFTLSINMHESFRANFTRESYCKQRKNKIYITENNIYISALDCYCFDMDFYFSLTDAPLAAYPASLRVAYCVFADPTYTSYKNGGWQSKIYVAVRTIGGLGKMILDGGREMMLTPDTIVFFDLNDIRNYYCASEHWDFWWFEFSVEELHDFPLDQLMPIKTFEEETMLCETCLEMLGKANQGMTRLASAVFSVLLCSWALQIERIKDKNPHRQAIETVINYMRMHLQEQITVKELAQIAGLCERRFRHVFEQITGMQPKRYLETLRINMAQELLVNTPLSIQEISVMLGYSNQFHFSKAFRDYNLMPPSKYRASVIFPTVK